MSQVTEIVERYAAGATLLSYATQGLTREQAETSPHRNVILQALGTRPNVAVALAKI